MKRLSILSAFGLLIMASCNQQASTSNNGKDTTATNQVFNLDTMKLKAGDIFYQCPMDPEVISDRPGTCPKCDMDLEERTKS